MQLVSVRAPLVSAEDTVMDALLDVPGKHKAFVGEAGLFIEQLAAHLGISPLRLARALYRLHAKRKIAKVKGGTNHFFIVGICLPGAYLTAADAIHVGDHRIE